jgi:hypothetical protein
MFASNRRVERRDDIIETIKEQGFEVAEIDDWSFLKHRDIFWKEQEA